MTKLNICKILSTWTVHLPSTNLFIVRAVLDVFFMQLFLSNQFYPLNIVHKYLYKIHLIIAYMKTGNNNILSLYKKESTNTCKKGIHFIMLSLHTLNNFFNNTCFNNF